MKSILQKLISENKQQEQDEAAAIQEEIDNPTTPDNRRDFLKKTAMGGIALTSLIGMTFEDSVAQTTSKVRKASNPSDLKITDMRYVTLDNGTSYTNARNVVIRIDTNQGIYGLGELRDGADPRYGLFLKSRILGLNPCNVEMIFKVIKQFGGHGRKAGGVSGVEMALWDLVGKAYDVPVWQLLGGKYRENVRLYAYVPAHNSKNMDIEKFKADCKVRMVDQGFTWLKMHPGIHVYSDVPGTVVNSKYIPGFNDDNLDNYLSYQNTRHAFTGVQITDKGLDLLSNYVGMIRDVVGYDIPLSADHFGHFDVNNCIRVANALEPYRLASLEDFVPWDNTEQLKHITDSINSPTITGEDIFGKEEFRKLCDVHAVDIVHPDMGTSGGILETKKIGDYAEETDVAMKMHFAGTPISFMANVHCAAATQNFMALELPVQCVDNPWWPQLVKMVGKKPLYTKGFAHVPTDAPGLGVELNEDELKKHLHAEDDSYFRPTPEWDAKRSHDRLWS
ncbi:MAG: mandelate racemase/muconate lactonizing enzyme family protein [Imperialibacter sp.]|uniref:mandelate racemase/muconate lactonizing enzyme family protein n=1 Tax=Imperialibacter sp. TaxID=2038411 RepID=UPI003A85624B